jgi:RimJ/RimL family protein N-acetyltransferase
MSALTKTAHGVGGYLISMEKDEKLPLSIKITTHRLFIRNIKLGGSDPSDHKRLFRNPTNVKYATQEVAWTAERIDNSINEIWSKAWKDGSPYGGYSIFTSDTYDFAGHFSMTEVAPGEVSLSLLLSNEFWNKGYATELLESLGGYVSFLQSEGYLVKGAPLSRLWAYIHPDNKVANYLISKKANFIFDGVIQKSRGAVNGYTKDFPAVKLRSRL